MKKILLSILGLLIGFVGFGYCDDITIVSYQSKFSSSVGPYSFLLSNFIVNSPFNLTGFSIHVPVCSESIVNSQFLLLFNVFDNVFSNLTGYVNYIRCNSDYYFSFDDLIITDSFSFSFTGFSVDGYSNSFTFYSSPVYSDDRISFSSNIGSFFSVLYGEFLPSIPKFIVNYGNQSKEYEMTSDIDIYINSPVSKNGSTFIYDGSTGINLVYNGQYNWYIKNKLYLDGQFRYRQGVFTPICL